MNTRQQPTAIAMASMMADAVRAYPWHETTLGPIEKWPAAVRVTVNSVLASDFPACVCFGSDLVMVYNDAFVPILGAKPFALGRSFKDTWAEAWAEIGPIAEKAAAGLSTFIADYELEVQRYAFKETAYFTFCYSPVYDEHGVVIGLLDTVFETTDKVLSDRRVRAFADKLEQEVSARTVDRDRMWTQSRDAMIALSHDGRIQSVNPAFQRLLQWNEAELGNRTFQDLVAPQDRDALETALASRPERSAFDVEVSMLRKTGGYALVDWAAVWYDDAIMAIGRDMTSIRAAQANLRQTELALQQAQKTEAIGRLTGGVAHDFNNLLQVISGNLQLLSVDFRGDEKAAHRLEQALSGVSRGAKLANQLLAFSRKQVLDPRVAKVGRAITSMDDMLRRTLSEEYEIELIIAVDLWNTFVDTAQVENALLNLCINARDAMVDGGRVTIEASNVILDEIYARKDADVAPGEYVLLAVSDTGSGMSQEVIDKAFDPFFTTKGVGKGTGLGLSMVFGFVKQSGGHIKIYSEVGHGSTIKIYLPRSLDAEDAVEKADERAVIGGTETILVVEDDQTVRETVIDLLHNFGYKVLKAHDAASALNVVESGIPIDLLFTDVIMPGPLRSPELAARARELLPDIALLYTSGYTESAIVRDGKLDPGVDLISKPYTREALARKIRHVLANRRQVLRKPNLTADLYPTSATNIHVLFVDDDANIRLATAELIESLGHTLSIAESAEEALLLLTDKVNVLVTDLELRGTSGADLAERARKIMPRLGIVFATGGTYQGTLQHTISLSKPYSLDRLDEVIREAENVAIAR